VTPNDEWAKRAKTLTCPVLISRLDERSLRLRMRRLRRKVFAAVPVRDDPGGADLHRLPCGRSKTDRQGRRAGRPTARHPQETAGTHRRRDRTIGTSQEIKISTAPFLTVAGKHGFEVKEAEALQCPADALQFGQNAGQFRCERRRGTLPACGDCPDSVRSFFVKL
jgi:hypothetical protein